MSVPVSPVLESPPPAYAAGDSWIPQAVDPSKISSYWPSDAPQSTVQPHVTPASINIPEVNCLTQGDVPSSLRERSLASMEKNGDGMVVGCDKMLNFDGEAVMQFFVTHLNRPTLAVHINGYHVERRVRHHTRSNGTHYTTTENVNVDDFNFTIDATAFVKPDWNFLYSHPKTFHETIQAYAVNKSTIKSIQLLKNIDWDYEALKQALTNLVRSTGYRHNIVISFPKSHDKITVRNDSFLSNLSNNTCAKVLCVLSCLWIIAWPVKKCLDYEDENSITASYSMLMSGSEFYGRNAPSVINHVMQKTRNQNLIPSM